MKSSKAPVKKKLALDKNIILPQSLEAEVIVEDIDLNCPSYYINREINWLDFNKKVLNEAIDSHNPLFEQLKFLSIFYNNLDEFFMVRVANVLRQYANNVSTHAFDKMTPTQQLAEIRKRTLALIQIAHTHWHKHLKVKLEEKKINIKKYNALSKKQQKFLDAYYEQEIYPVLTPQAIDPTHPMPVISNLSLNFIVKLRGQDHVTRYARLKCPNNLPRFIFVPRHQDISEYDKLGLSYHSKDCDIVFLEEAILTHIHTLFTGYEVEEAGLFRITRNTDVKIEEDEAYDLLKTVKDMVDQRRFGNVVRLEVSQNMPSELVRFLSSKLWLKPFQIYKVKGILAFSEMIGLYDIDRPHLKFESFQPHIPKGFQEPTVNTLFDYLKTKEVFLFHPYDSFMAVQEFIKQASHDPQVIAIKQTLYRTGKNSPIVQSLMEARRLGKQVTAVVELKARFDEEQNITWAEELEKAGVHVVYGIAGMKIHVKLCLVVRKEGHNVNRYVHVGTGNYNPSTAKMYTDMGLITSEPDICADVSDLFNVMTGYAIKTEYRHLLVSPVSMRKGLFACIEDEIAFHKEFGNGEIYIKCNQLADIECIQALYKASRAGVKVYAQIRGVCCLRPQVPNLSENIEVTSIVGRFLEHARIFCFHHNGNKKMYIGSADLMQRNLDRRIEALTPILKEELREHIYQNILLPYFQDNVKTYKLQADGTYTQQVSSAQTQKFNIQEFLLDNTFE